MNAQKRTLGIVVLFLTLFATFLAPSQAAEVTTQTVDYSMVQALNEAVVAPQAEAHATVSTFNTMGIVFITALLTPWLGVALYRRFQENCIP
ncbi:hypothetical protein ACN08X_00545 [Rothia sp. P6271]|uniref:hypothetical protein n=1 Tax=unclassified Rothia (in: high G+C Gram-positive bacteria) TaxID=2689056 RepID=UPI003AD4C81D